MTGRDHYDRAEELLARITDISSHNAQFAQAIGIVALAHAQLAAAARDYGPQVAVGVDLRTAAGTPVVELGGH